MRIRRCVRCVRWSRPPASTGTPRRRRLMTTRHVSTAGMPTKRRPTASDCQAVAASDVPIMTSAAIAKPTGMEPPSPRKIRAGRARLCGRKPRHAPHRAAADAASHVSARTSPSTHTPPAATAAMVAAAPSMLSNRLNALTTAVSQATVRTTSTTGPAPRFHPTPSAHSQTASPASTPRRSHGERSRRSSMVPTTHSTATHTSRGVVRAGTPAKAATPTTKAAQTAAPPRYGVGDPCAL